MLLQQKDSEINLIEAPLERPTPTNFFTGQENLLSEIELAASNFGAITGFGAHEKSMVSTQPQLEH
jgi:hypothetical protein